MSIVAQVLLVALAAAAMVACLVLLPTAAPLRFARRPNRTPSGQPPAQLREASRLVSGAAGGNLYAHAYLRPVLTDIAAGRLAAHGWELSTLPEKTGRELLGDALWELVRPDRRLPEDRHARGITEQELAVMLDVLARL